MELLLCYLDISMILCRDYGVIAMIRLYNGKTECWYLVVIMSSHYSKWTVMVK